MKVYIAVANSQDIDPETRNIGVYETEAEALRVAEIECLKKNIQAGENCYDAWVEERDVGTSNCNMIHLEMDKYDRWYNSDLKQIFAATRRLLELEGQSANYIDQKETEFLDQIFVERFQALRNELQAISHPLSNISGYNHTYQQRELSKTYAKLLLFKEKIDNVECLKPNDKASLLKDIKNTKDALNQTL
jgi:hypothetical protein